MPDASFSLKILVIPSRSKAQLKTSEESAVGLRVHIPRNRSVLSPAAKLASRRGFEKARLQPRHDSHQMNAALAAKGI
jgi:hypothetical protein